MYILSLGIFSSLEKKSQIGFDIFEGTRDPIDLISIKQQGSWVLAKYIGNESINRTITKFSDLLSKEETKPETLERKIWSFSTFLLTDIVIKGNFINF